jgi:FkbM family methyltransferase
LENGAASIKMAKVHARQSPQHFKPPRVNPFRQLARSLLPAAIRKPLGAAANRAYCWAGGMIFDLRGGKFRTGDCQFIIPRDQTSRTYRASFLTNHYEVEDLEVVRACIVPTDRVIELGGCMGVVSCVTNKILSDQSRHLVVEANPFCIPTLHRNRDLNHCQFLIEHCAVSQSREVTFHVHPGMIVSSSIQRQADVEIPVRVPARSLTELDARYGPFTALIIDIEGAELETFENARELLRRYRMVIVELHDWALGENGLKHCREILAGAGLQCRKKVKWVEAWERI